MTNGFDEIATATDVRFERILLVRAGRWRASATCSSSARP
nr:hypothetical protein [Bradyrhizobium sp. 184]